MELFNDLIERNKIIGIVFDISINHDDFTGSRIIDIVKKILINKILISKINFLAFVGSKDYSFPKNYSESIAKIDMYIEPADFNVNQEIRKICKIIGENNDQEEKHILILTDRFESKLQTSYKSAFLVKSANHYDYKVHYCSIGSNSDHDLLEKLAEKEGANFAHLKNPQELKNYLEKFGENNG